MRKRCFFLLTCAFLGAVSVSVCAMERWDDDVQMAGGNGFGPTRKRKTPDHDYGTGSPAKRRKLAPPAPPPPPLFNFEPGSGSPPHFPLPYDPQEDSPQRKDSPPLRYNFWALKSHTQCENLCQPQDAVRMEVMNCDYEGTFKEVFPYLIRASKNNPLESLSFRNVTIPGVIKYIEKIIVASRETLKNISISECGRVQELAFMKMLINNLRFSDLAGKKITLNGHDMHKDSRKKDRIEDIFKKRVSVFRAQNNPIKSLIDDCENTEREGGKRFYVPGTELLATLEKFIALQKEFILKNIEKNSYRLDARYIDRLCDDNNKISYVCKEVLGDFERKHEVVVIGDLHGSAYSLARNFLKLQREKILDENYQLKDGARVIFTGDIADGGSHDILTWYTVMKFALLNRGKVFVCRGNHEMSRGSSLVYGLHVEICRELYNPFDFFHYNQFYEDCRKFYAEKCGFVLPRGYFMKEGDFLYAGLKHIGWGPKKSPIMYIFNGFIEMFGLLPSAVYVGRGGEFVQANHGGMPVWIDKNKRVRSMDYGRLSRFLQSDDMILPIGEMEKKGFLDNDFCFEEGRISPYPTQDKNRVKIPVGTDSFTKLFQSVPMVKCILRGHQHNNAAVSFLVNTDHWEPLKKEVFLARQKRPIYTFMSCPEHGLESFNRNGEFELTNKHCCFVDGFGVLSVFRGFECWTLRAYSTSKYNLLLDSLGIPFHHDYDQESPRLRNARKNPKDPKFPRLLDL